MRQSSVTSNAWPPTAESALSADPAVAGTVSLLGELTSAVWIAVPVALLFGVALGILLRRRGRVDPADRYFKGAGKVKGASRRGARSTGATETEALQPPGAAAKAAAAAAMSRNPSPQRLSFTENARASREAKTAKTAATQAAAEAPASTGAGAGDASSPEALTAEMRLRISTLERDLEQARALARRQAEDLARRQGRQEALRGQIDEQRGRMRHLARIFADLARGAGDEALDRVMGAGAAVIGLGQGLGEVHRWYVSLESRVEDWRRQLNAARQHFGVSAEEVKALVKRLEELKAEGAEQAVGDLDQRATSLEAHLRAFEHTVTSYDGSLGELERQILGEHEQLAAVAQRLRPLETRLQSLVAAEEPDSARETVAFTEEGSSASVSLEPERLDELSSQLKVAESLVQAVPQRSGEDLRVMFRTIHDGISQSLNGIRLALDYFEGGERSGDLAVAMMANLVTRRQDQTRQTLEEFDSLMNLDPVEDYPEEAAADRLRDYLASSDTALIEARRALSEASVYEVRPEPAADAGATMEPAPASPASPEEPGQRRSLPSPSPSPLARSLAGLEREVPKGGEADDPADVSGPESFAEARRRLRELGASKPGAAERPVAPPNGAEAGSAEGDREGSRVREDLARFEEASGKLIEAVTRLRLAAAAERPPGADDEAEDA